MAGVEAVPGFDECGCGGGEGGGDGGEVEYVVWEGCAWVEAGLGFVVEESDVVLDGVVLVVVVMLFVRGGA